MVLCQLKNSLTFGTNCSSSSGTVKHGCYGSEPKDFWVEIIYLFILCWLYASSLQHHCLVMHVYPPLTANNGKQNFVVLECGSTGSKDLYEFTDLSFHIHTCPFSCEKMYRCLFNTLCNKINVDKKAFPRRLKRLRAVLYINFTFL